MELAKLADGLGMKPEMVGKGKNWRIGDFAFNDSDPEKMTAYDKYMYDNYTVSVQMMIPIEEA
jgi:hypothetical protein